MNVERIVSTWYVPNEPKKVLKCAFCPVRQKNVFHIRELMTFSGMTMYVTFQTIRTTTTMLFVRQTAQTKESN